MQPLQPAKTTESDVLAEAVLNAGREPGLAQADVGKIIGRDRGSIRRNGINPMEKSGEMAAMLVRIYGSLYALFGDDQKTLRYWLNTENLHTRGIPRQQLFSVNGLVTVLHYLDVMRGKI
ncbi:MAG TPA: MbcA/ParS/Xre antitoxin family protein [Acidiferrobacter sp.]|nr:MbcA/ParS/Xre antitoxin family protein [Acidiferrobacter sp.]